MPYYKFGPQDLFHNVIETHPKYDFEIFDSKVYINNEAKLVGVNSDPLKHVPVGYLNLYEINIDRPSGQLVYPFVVKNGSLHAFNTISTNTLNRSYSYGDTINGSYPLSASITKEYFVSDATRKESPDHITALKTTFDNYIPLSRHYAYSSSSLGTITWNKEQQQKSLISIPSIFYGSSIKKGSVDLKFYISGSLIARCVDKYENGELIHVSSSSPDVTTYSGSVAGVVLYNEGFILLTGSWDLSNGNHTARYDGLGSATTPKWLHFGSGMNDGVASGLHPSSSFGLSFEGTNYIPTVTMLAHAKKGELNYSSNWTHIEKGQISTVAQTVAAYHEPTEIRVKNTIKSPYNDPTGSYEKQTFISRVGIFDKNKNLIAIAKLANPVKKRQDRDYTFKLKLDF